ncbi:D-alanine--D-alanine ligase A [Clostridia bacterium]|nr:D-alanine--D-alanine ligase A [Clostridia bacterium]
MNIVVLTGGASSERDVALISSSAMAKQLRANKHKVIELDVCLGLIEFSVTKSQSDVLKIIEARGGSYFSPDVIPICQNADFVFNVCHGGNGENGRIQAVFDCFGIKYSGSGYLGSAIAMNKAVTKQILVSAAVPTAEYEVFAKGDTLEIDMPFPVVVKAQSEGSSVGIYVAHNNDEFVSVCGQAFEFDDVIIVEKFISGKEFSVGIVGETVLPVIEIRHSGEMWDYTSKYTKGQAEEICPAPISSELNEVLKREALRAYKALRLSGYARIDFLSDSDDNIYCLEANTIPGMTPTSLLPQEAAAIGWSYADLCEEMIKESRLAREVEG